jgi:hypothetical protein
MTSKFIRVSLSFHRHTVLIKREIDTTIWINKYMLRSDKKKVYFHLLKNVQEKKTSNSRLGLTWF